jgi:predicted nucleic acid-binding protein
MMIIANATPLIYLHRIGQLELLHQLFSQVTIPEEVAKELQMGQHGEATIPEFPWITVMPVQHRSTVDVLAQDLDHGEAEVLALALEHTAAQVIIDDALARTAATLLHIPCIGTLGILIACKTRGLITTVKAPLDTMMAAGLWIAPALYEQVLHKLGEL